MSINSLSILLLSAFFLLQDPCISSGQKIDNTASFRDINSVRYFRFSYDNDFFTATDKNYTQGYNFELVAPFLKKNPVNRLFFKIKNIDDSHNNILNKYGLAWEHIGFTPDDYGSSKIQFDDRPFASAMMLKSFLIQTNVENNFRFSSALSVGVIGPAAFGGKMQTQIHEWTGDTKPRGWQYQIANDVVLNYEMRFEKQLFRASDYFSFQTNTNVRLGTLFSDASLSGNFTAGLINTPFDKEEKHNFQLYLYGQPILKLVGYDATLQGGIFTQNKSPYTIESSKIARVRTALNYGVVLKVGRMYFEYSQAFQSRELDGAEYYRWGGLKAGFMF